MLIRQPIVLLEKRRLTDIRTTQIMGMYPVRVCAPCDNWSGPRVRGVNTEVSPSRLNTTPVAPRAVLISLKDLRLAKVPKRIMEPAASRTLDCCNDA